MNKKILIFYFLIVFFAGIGFGLIFLSTPPEKSTIQNTTVTVQTPATQDQSSVPLEQTSPPLIVQSQEQKGATASPEQAQVKRAIDGDTLAVVVNGKEEKVRLLGIDTPETVDPRKPVQCFGKEASNQMQQLVGGRNVTMAPDPTNSNRDKYKRLLRYVYLEDGTLVNSWMVEHGYAFAYTVFPFTNMENFIELQRSARQNELGLWNSTVCPYYRSKVIP